MQTYIILIEHAIGVENNLVASIASSKKFVVLSELRKVIPNQCGMLCFANFPIWCIFIKTPKLDNNYFLRLMTCDVCLN